MSRYGNVNGRPGWTFVALATLVFAGVLYFGSGVVRESLDHFLRVNAMARLQDWAVHIAEEHPALLQELSNERKRRALVAHLDREAEFYGVVRYSIIGGNRRLDRVPGGNVSGGEERTPVSGSIDMAGLLWSDGDEALPPRLTVAIPGARGKTVAHLEARVDQTHLRALLSDSVVQILLIGLAGLLLTGVVAWNAHRQIMRDANHKLSILSGRDMLTGLLNRSRFAGELERMLKRADEKEAMVVFFHLDVDNFGNIISSHGYDASDKFLQVIAVRLMELAGKEGLLCRLDGDEFALAWIVRDEGEARALGERICRTMRMPVAVDGRKIHYTISTGAALYPRDAASLKLLERRAAFVCWVVGGEGGNDLRFYNTEVRERHEEYLALEKRLKQAIEEDGFELHFQPLVHLQDGSLYGFEALVRMHDGQDGLIAPDRFISLAERLHLMDALGGFVIRESCKIAAQWPDHLRIAVNVSPAQFKSGTLAAEVEKALVDAGLAPDRLEIEVTESFLVEDSPFIQEQLQALRELGVRIVLDDFGTGYSSLHYLWRFRFDKVKIDRSFIAAMDTSMEARSILRAMLLMFRALGVPVTAEGIEDAHQAAFLRKLRCETGQGYYFGRPMAAMEIAALVLRDWQKRQGDVESLPVLERKRA